MSTLAGFFGALWLTPAWLFANTARLAASAVNLASGFHVPPRSW
jgi:hypothetical protein